MFKKTVIASALVLGLSACAPKTPSPQQEVDLLANSLDINFEIITNHGNGKGVPCAELGADYAACNKVNLVLTNLGPDVDIKNWQIYFHSIRPILASENDAFEVTHITGDLHKIEPTAKFTGFEQQKTFEIPLVAESWYATYTDFMPRAFITAPNAEARNVESTNTEDSSEFVDGLSGKQVYFSESDNNERATASSRYKKHQQTEFVDVEKEILPTPKRVQATGGTLGLESGIDLSSLPLAKASRQVLINQFDLLGIEMSNQGVPVKVSYVPRSKVQSSEGYRLEITEDEILIEAHSDTGVFYALQSVLSLIDPMSPHAIPSMQVEDHPRMKYRGFMVDVARNFHSKESILKTLDQMSAIKMNKLHLHLSEDEGWRLEIPGLPELTQVGGNRCFDLSERSCLLPQLGSGADNNNFGSGYFSREDYIEILKYAKARFIEVIPEIDMPAHSRAAVVSMEARYQHYMEQGDQAKAEQYRLMDPEDASKVTTVQFYDRQSFINPCLTSSKRFVAKVISEVKMMHDEAGMPLKAWHYGGDEAKNIKLGAGFQDSSTAPSEGKGSIDLASENKPYQLSPSCVDMMQAENISDVNELLTYFSAEVSEIVDANHIPTFQIWSDGLKYNDNSDDFASAKVRVNLWDTVFWGAADKANQLSEDGYQLVLSNPDFVYFDMPYEVDKHERGYYWATRATDTQRAFSFVPQNLAQNAELTVDRGGNEYSVTTPDAPAPDVYGISAALWSETIRTDEQYEYMAFPRLFAVAERSWNKGEWEQDYVAKTEYSSTTQQTDLGTLNQDWSRFANILGQRELAKAELRDLNFRLPVPGARVEDGELAMNVSFPGIVMEYSTNMGETWHTYYNHERPEVSGVVLLRSVSPSGQRSSRVTLLAAK